MSNREWVRLFAAVVGVVLVFAVVMTVLYPPNRPFTLGGPVQIDENGNYTGE